MQLLSLAAAYASDATEDNRQQQRTQLDGIKIASRGLACHTCWAARNALLIIVGACHFLLLKPICCGGVVDIKGATSSSQRTPQWGDGRKRVSQHFNACCRRPGERAPCAIGAGGGKKLIFDQQRGVIFVGRRRSSNYYNCQGTNNNAHHHGLPPPPRSA